MMAELRAVDASPLRYLLSVPPSEAFADGPPPVLCFLHGYDEAAPLDIHHALTRHGPLRTGSWHGAVERFVVVAPQLATAGDIWARHADDVWALVEHARREHGGDRTRTYLTGFSFGGNGVFDLALRQPDRWAALWSVDPTRVPRQPVARPVWLSVGTIARLGRDAFVHALALRDAAADVTALVHDRYFLDEGADHVGSAALAYADARIYGWLLSQRLSDAP